MRSKESRQWETLCWDNQNKINPDIMDMNEDWWETPDMTGVVTQGRGRKFYSFLDEISTSIQAAGVLYSQHIICISEVTYSIFSFLLTTSCKDISSWRYREGPWWEYADQSRPVAEDCKNNNNNYQVKPCPGLALVRTTDDTAGNNQTSMLGKY